MPLELVQEMAEHDARAALADRHLVPFLEARAILGGIGNNTLYKLIARGELVRHAINRRVFITSDSLAAYLDRAEGKGDAAMTDDTDDPCRLDEAMTEVIGRLAAQHGKSLRVTPDPNGDGTLYQLVDNPDAERQQTGVGRHE